MEPSNPENKNNPNEEHETHTTALVFLVIASLIIAYVALTYSGDISSPGDRPGEDDQTPATTTEATSSEEFTHGSIIPQDVVEATEASGVAGLPSGIYVNESEIRRNDTLPAGEGEQRIISFVSNESISDLVEQYRGYIETSSFSMTDVLQDNTGAKLSASREGDQLTVSITTGSEEGVQSQVKISFITSSS